MNWKKIVLILTIIIAFISIVFLYAHKKDTKESTSIGVICDLTGAVAEYGTWVQNGIAIALETIKETDPDFDVSFEDGQTRVDKALNAFTRYTSFKNTHMIICGCNSSSIMSIDPIANKTNTLVFSTIASSPNMYKTCDFVFSNRVTGTTEMECIVNNLYDLSVKSIAIIAHNNEAGMPYIESFSDAIRDKNVKVVAKILVEPNNEDFRMELIKLKELNPDAVLLITPAEQTHNFIRQAKNVNFSSRWLGISTLKTDGFIRIGGDLVEKMVIASEDVDESNPLFLDFEKKYKKRFNETPTIYAVNGYDAVMIFYTLLKKYGDDIDAAQKALCLEQFQSLSGQISFDKNGMIQNKKVSLFEIQEGSFIRKK